MSKVPSKITFSVAIGVGMVVAAAIPALAVISSTGWSISYQLPGQTGSTDEVNAVAATGPDDAWAVGGKPGVLHGQGVGVPAVFHWNGRSWSQVALPGPVHVGYFSAVSASSATDVWAIGGCNSGCTSFAANWNGVKWTWHSSPAAADSAMAAFSPSDVWVADYGHLDEWTGNSWRRFSAPGWNGVWTIAGTGPKNIWAGGLASGTLQPEVLHWNGTSWSNLRLPALALPTNGEAVPQSIAVDSASDVWVDGIIEYPQPSTGLTEFKPFVLHWNGSTWQQLAVPASFPSGFGLSWLTSDGAGGFWADAVQPSASGTSSPMKLVHFNSGAWTITPVPPIPGSAVFPSAPAIDDLTQVPGTGQIWAPVLYSNLSEVPRDVILRYIP
jgi:hypothetical protein